MAVLIVLCFVSVLLLSSQSGASFSTYLLTILMLVTFASWKDVLQVYLMRWILALMVWMSASALWSSPFELREAISIWIRALLIVCFVVAFAECQLRGYLRRWLTSALTLVGAVVVLVAIANFFITEPVDGRLNGLGQLDTHVVAALVYGVVLLFVLQHFLDTKHNLLKFSLGVIILLIAFAVLLSDSRNAWVSALIGCITLVLAWRVDDPKKFAIALASATVLLLAVLTALISNTTMVEWILPRGDSFRLSIWTHTLERIQDGNAWIGLGIITDDDLAIGKLTFPHPHNMYLAVAYQSGIIGLLLYLTVLGSSLKSLIEHYEHPDAKIALAILSLALSSHLLDGHELIDKVGDTWFLIWLPVGIALGLRWQSVFRAQYRE